MILTKDKIEAIILEIDPDVLDSGGAGQAAEKIFATVNNAKPIGYRYRIPKTQSQWAYVDGSWPEAWGETTFEREALFATPVAASEIVSQLGGETEDLRNVLCGAMELFGIEAVNQITSYALRYRGLNAFDGSKVEMRSSHPDDLAVDRFAQAMKAKLAKKRAEGYGGWDNPEECTIEHLSHLLINHLAKGDPVDIGNFSMMIHQRGGSIGSSEPDPAEPKLYGPYGYLNGCRALTEDTWVLENDPLENSDEYFSIPLFAKVDVSYPVSVASPAPQLGAVKAYVTDMKTSSGTDHFVMLSCDGRELSLYMFKQQNRAEFTASELNWLINGGEKPDSLALKDEESRG